MTLNNTRDFHIHLVSDATGETVNAVARACVVQLENVNPIEHVWSLVRTRGQMQRVAAGIAENPGPVVFTVVDPGLRVVLEESCREMGLPCISIMDSVLAGLAAYAGSAIRGQPGRQHVMDTEYFERIEAVHFTMSHDDGQLTHDLNDADIIVVGVSRTSKTPTCIYLAQRGIKVANIPLVPGCPVPPELETVTRPMVVGLTKDPKRLIEIRRNRLRMLNQEDTTDYVDPDAVKAETQMARRLCSRHGWPVIDVTRKSIEETAAAILTFYGEFKDTHA
ncbi:MAG: pyruvate, water dikinase regulatory protein [Rhodospirillales bacterium]